MGGEQSTEKRTQVAAVSTAPIPPDVLNNLNGSKVEFRPTERTDEPGKPAGIVLRLNGQIYHPEARAELSELDFSHPPATAGKPLYNVDSARLSAPVRLPDGDYERVFTIDGRPDPKQAGRAEVLEMWKLRYDSTGRLLGARVDITDGSPTAQEMFSDLGKRREEQKAFGVKDANVLGATQYERVRLGMNTSNAPHTVASVLGAIESTAGLKQEGWVGRTAANKNAVEAYNALLSELPGVSQYLKSKGALGDPAPVNRFLRENGFNIKLEGSGDPGAAYGAAVLDMPVRWERPGVKTDVTLDGSDKVVPGVSLSASTLVGVFKSPAHSSPVVAVKTQGDVTVFVTKVGKQEARGDVLEFVNNVNNSLQRDTAYGPGTQLVMPMAEYQQTGDISSLVGLKNGGHTIGVAKYVHRLRLNEEGARAQAAAAVATTRGFTRNVYVDGEYAIWFKTSSGAIPFAARIDEASMKNPGSLDRP